jgi:glycosyltransferase involved in cell wall biosynthesis
VNGYVFEEGDIDALTDRLHSVVKDAMLREKMGEASKEKINQFSHQVTSQNIKTELKSK